MKKLEQLVGERKTLEKELAEVKRQLVIGGGDDQGVTEVISGTNFFGRVIEGVDAKELRGIVDETKTKLGSAIVVIIGISVEGKVGISVGVTADLIDVYNAVDLVRIGSAVLGGKGGGGRADMAQAGGPNGDDADKAMDAIKNNLNNR